MANYSTARLEQLFLQIQPTFGIIPNTSGTASVGNANACRFIGLTFENESAIEIRPDKTGTRSQQGVVGGRRSGRWSIDLSAVTSGTLGTVPDSDPLLQSIFGQTATIGAGTFAITSSTDATPIVLTTAAHGQTAGTVGYLTVAGHLINIGSNQVGALGLWAAYFADGTHATLIGSIGAGQGAGSGGTISFINCKYALSDTILQFTAYSFRSPSTLDQRCANNCVASQISFALGQNIARMSASGVYKWMTSSKSFATDDSEVRGGLTAFPVVPTTPVTNGNAIVGFTGRFVVGASDTNANFALNATQYPTIRASGISIQTRAGIALDTFGDFYGQLTEAGERSVTIGFSIYDDDSASVAALKYASDYKVPQDLVVNIGAVAGSIFLFHIKNVYLASNQLTDGQLRFTANFGESMATATSLSLKDEITMILG